MSSTGFIYYKNVTEFYKVLRRSELYLEGKIKSIQNKKVV